MKYIVLKYFTDLQDNDYAYHAGDTFPREGVAVAEERLKELSTDQNKRGIPLIEAVAEDKPELKAEPQAEPEPMPEIESEVEIEPEKDEPEETIAKEAEAPKRGRKSKK